MIQFITSNLGKFKEVRQKLREAGIELKRIELPYPEIQGGTLRGVVEEALSWLSSRVKGDFLIDDSGLFIESLKGFPGVYSSFVFKSIGCEGIIKLLEGKEDRRARFECYLGLRWRGGNRVFKGVCKGQIAEKPRGGQGFGFDPIFVPEGEERTFGEMSRKEKNEISHRSRAVESLLSSLKGEGEWARP